MEYNKEARFQNFANLFEMLDIVHFYTMHKGSDGSKVCDIVDT